MTPRALLVQRIMFAVDGYRLGEWSLSAATARIVDALASAPKDAL